MGADLEIDDAESWIRDRAAEVVVPSKSDVPQTTPSSPSVASQHPRAHSPRRDGLTRYANAVSALGAQSDDAL